MEGIIPTSTFSPPLITERMFFVALAERFDEAIKQAMKAHEKRRLSTLRMMKSSLRNEAIAQGRELSEDEELSVLSRELKQRKDSLQEYEKAGRDDLASGEREEIEVIEAYMPEPLSDEELETLIRETIDDVGATQKSDMGNVMSAIMPKVKGKADGGKVNKLVQAHLS